MSADQVLRAMSYSPMSPSERDMEIHREAHIASRAAMKIVSDLPRDSDAAMAILSAAQRLVEWERQALAQRGCGEAG